MQSNPKAQLNPIAQAIAGEIADRMIKRLAPVIATALVAAAHEFDPAAAEAEAVRRTAKRQQAALKTAA